jgi:hypothetical protein
MRLLLLVGVIFYNRLCLKLDKSEFELAQLVSKVTLENLPWVSPEMSYLHKVQVNKSSSSVQTEKVKLHRKKEVGGHSKIFVCWL